MELMTQPFTPRAESLVGADYIPRATRGVGRLRKSAAFLARRQRGQQIPLPIGRALDANWSVITELDHQPNDVDIDRARIQIALHANRGRQRPARHTGALVDDQRGEDDRLITGKLNQSAGKGRSPVMGIEAKFAEFQIPRLTGDDIVERGALRR